MDVCLLVDGKEVCQWQANTVEQLKECEWIDIKMVVYSKYQNTRTLFETVKRGIEIREWAVANIVSTLASDNIKGEEKVPIKTIIDADNLYKISVKPEIIDGWKQKIPTETAQKAAKHADVGVRFGFGFLVGPILSELEYGVLSYHHGDIREYRGRPMGFWEFIHGEKTAGVTVQQLTEELDAGKVAASETVDISDQYTWESIKQELYRASDDVIIDAVRAVQDGDIQEPKTLGQLYSTPKGKPVLLFILKNTKGILKEKWT